MKKYLLTALLLFTMIMTLVACGSEEVSSDTDVNNSATNQTEVEVPDEPDEPDVSVDVDTDTDAEVDTDTEVGKEETPDEDSGTVDENVEMVDWETWATQADNDEVCIVVWNETTGTQKILKSISDNGMYTVQEGDRFAVPRRDNIDCVDIGFSTTLYWESDSQNYIEFELSVGEIKQVYIICSDSDNAISYFFN